MNATAMTMTMAALGLAAQTFAAVTITNVTCQQRYPWNGLVDIDYEIQSDDAEATYFVYPKGEDRRLGTPIIMHTLSGDGATDPVGVGQHRMVWDAKADMPNFHTPDLAVTLQAIAQGAQYLVIDLSGGTNAVTYPVRYSTTPPDITKDTCRTTELWLRLVLPGTFMMGSPETEEGRQSDEQQHQVRLTRPYYIGVFEVTQKQWMLISGIASAIYFAGDCRPVDSVSYKMVRGTNLGLQWPNEVAVDADSFLGTLNRKTSLKFDLPTEAQWEYACRAGTTSTLNNDGSGANDMRQLGRYSENLDDGHESYGEHTKVGMYLPNAWGLYDMHGNVREWCRDHYLASLATTDTVDPVGSDNTGATCVFRGGFWHSFNWKDCRSAERSSASTGKTNDGDYWREKGCYGFRLVCLPVE